MIVARIMSENRKLQQEVDRLTEALRRIAKQDYDDGYSAEEYADAVLAGVEPLDQGT